VYYVVQFCETGTGFVFCGGGTSGSLAGSMIAIFVRQHRRRARWWRRNAIQKAHRRSAINNLANRQQTTQTRSVSSGAVGRAGGKQSWLAAGGKSRFLHPVYV
jgi:hypothetical protein